MEIFILQKDKGARIMNLAEYTRKVIYNHNLFGETTITQGEFTLTTMLAEVDADNDLGYDTAYQITLHEGTCLISKTIIERHNIQLLVSIIQVYYNSIK